ncbi:MAG: glutamate--tRNA ligase [Thermoplasmata archaeon]|nr:glutamate--tRNA ligase [Thermoplasmata archaeon]
MENEIRKYALQNAVEHGGKADEKSVLGKILASNPSLKNSIKDLIPIIKKIVEEVNNMDQERQKSELIEIFPEALEKKKVVEKKALPDLPDVKGEVVMRLAPSPSGPLHIGHSRMAILNDEYVKRYGGRLILRIEDTNPLNVENYAYDMIKDDLNYLEVKIHEIVIQSDRFDLYYKYAKNLIEMGKAYITLCDEKEWRKLKIARKPCPDRDADASIHLERWDNMLSGKYDDREAVYVVKTDLNHPNPAIRDWAAFRIIRKAIHPRIGQKYIVYPLMNFSVAIDDHELGLTHVLRGKDHLNNTYRQIYIFDYFNWKKPVYIHYGKVKIEGSILKTSIIKKGIRDGTFKGWDDVRLGTLLAIKKRGIDPQAIRKYWVDAGIKDVDIIFSWENLYSYNRTIVDGRTKRYFFVWNPNKLSVSSDIELKSKAPLHPSHQELGFREYQLGKNFNIYISDSDYNNLKNNEMIRLKDLGNFEFENNSLKFLNNDLSLVKKLKIIHWVPENSVKCIVEMPDGNIVNGLAEPKILKIKNELVQFERFGFVNVFVSDFVNGYYAHG